ncbi:MAG: acetylxylan esterase, partial [Acidobacteria bacterium]|nr:acetylxylan esterase [Acidobacteriota bacterium]
MKLLLLLAMSLYPEWSVLYTDPQFAAPETMFSSYLEKKVHAQNAERNKVISSLTPAGLAEYRLRARSTGKLARDGYTIEKVIFESRPHYYVTANVYVPSGSTGPFPAVLCPVGHWGSGKYLEDYQRLGVWLARHGFIALVYDLPGQGERWQYYNAVLGRSIVDPGTSEYFVTIEHWLSAGPNILASDNFAAYPVWDGIRGLDYLTERRDVDPNRLACTGVSGGGLQTELLAAVDERIKVAIPVCYGGCAMETPTRPGLSAADVDVLIAPRPLLMIEATGDSRGGVLAKKERHEMVEKVYQQLGAAGKTRYIVVDGPHGYLAGMREEATRWFGQWMNAGTPAVTDRPTPLEPETALRASTTGQVTTALGGETVFSLTRADAEGVRAKPAIPAANTIARRIGYEPSTAPLNPKVVSRTEKLEKIVFYSDEGLYVPGLLFLPASPGP